MPVSNRINQMIFGSSGASSLTELQNNIFALQLKLAEELAKFEEARTRSSRFVNESMIMKFTDQVGHTMMSEDANGVVVQYLYHPIGWLIGPKQRESRNNGILFNGPSIYRTKVNISDLRAVTISNDSANSAPDFICSNTRRSAILSYASSLAATYEKYSNGTKKLLPDNAAVGLPYYMKDGNDDGITHPHATGRHDRFNSICFGNNKWAADLNQVKSSGDFMSLVYRMHLWVTTGNLHDMYGSYIARPMTSYVGDMSPTTGTKDIIMQFMKMLLIKVYKPIYDYYMSEGEESRLLLDRVPNSVAESIIQGFLPEFNTDKVYHTLIERCLDTLIIKTSDKHVLSPFMFPIIGFLQTLNSLYISNGLDFSITTIMQKANAVYAAYLLANKSLVPYERHTMYNDLRYTVMVTMNVDTPTYALERMLLSPLALKDTGSHSPAWLDYTK